MNTCRFCGIESNQVAYVSRISGFRCRCKAKCNKRELEKLRNESAMLQRLKSIGDQSEWRPIETAPKDGTIVLVWGIPLWILDRVPDWHKAAFKGDYEGDTEPYWHWGAPGYVGRVDATHWMPAPPPEGDDASKA